MFVKDMRIMDQERKDRYQEKINGINERLDLISVWIGEIYDENDTIDIKTQYALFKAFQEVVEGLMDLIAMSLRDQKIPSQDDYSNIDKIPIFTNKEKEVLCELNGLRNRVVHKYNSTDIEIALDRIISFITIIPTFVERFQKWIEET